jgi:hypothetical protein
MLSALCSTCEMNPKMLNFLVWLGYISSCINPLIYNAFNKKFRHAFKMILLCKFDKFKTYSFRRQNNINIKQNSFESSNYCSNRKRLSKSIRSANYHSYEMNSDEIKSDGNLNINSTRFKKPLMGNRMIEFNKIMSNKNSYDYV